LSLTFDLPKMRAISGKVSSISDFAKLILFALASFALLANKIGKRLLAKK
jgi:hypothetical protein